MRPDWIEDFDFSTQLALRFEPTLALSRRSGVPHWNRSQSGPQKGVSCENDFRIDESGGTLGHCIDFRAAVRIDGAAIQGGHDGNDGLTR